MPLHASLEPQDANRPRQTHVLLIRVALILLVLAAYWPVFMFPYVCFDDQAYVFNNDYVKNGLTMDGFAWAARSTYAANWHPLTWISLMIDTSLLGDNPFGHHIVNVAIHAINSILVLTLLLLLTKALWRSAIVAALVAVHPMHVESVAWISERKDVLCMLFWLLSTISYVHYVRNRSITAYSRLLLFMCLAAASKPTIVTLPFTLLLLDFWPISRIPNVNQLENKTTSNGRHTVVILFHLVLEKLPLFCISFITSVLAATTQFPSGSFVPEGHWLKMSVKIEIVIISYALYVRRFIFPSDLSIMHPNLYQIGRSMYPMSDVVITFLLIMAITALVVIVRRSHPYLIVAWLWFLGTLAPVIGFVQIGRHLVADRYAYVPYLGLYIGVVWMVASIIRRTHRPWCVALVGGVILLLTSFAHRYVWAWQSTEALYKHAIHSTRDNWFAYYNLASTLESDGRIDEAAASIAEATKICDTCSWVYVRHGQILIRQGRLHDARQYFEKAVILDRKNLDALMQLGAVMMVMGRYQSAIVPLQTLMNVYPDNISNRKVFTVNLILAGDCESAFESFVEMIRMGDSGQSSEWLQVVEVLGNGNSRNAVTFLPRSD